jgi:hypothetical protein
MKIKYHLPIIIVFIFTLASCATSKGPFFTYDPLPENSDPFLYIYRPKSNYLQYAKWEFGVDDKTVITLTNGSYAKISVKPGKHDLISGGNREISQPPIKITIECKKGKNSFVKYEFKTSLIKSLLDRPKFNNLFYEVAENVAIPELKETRLTTIPLESY